MNSGAKLLGLGLGSSTLCLFLVGGYLVSATALWLHQIAHATSTTIDIVLKALLQAMDVVRT